MATVNAVTFAVLGLVLMYSSLVVWTALILPGPVGRARTRLETRPLASLAAGIGVVLATLLVFVGYLAVRGPWLNLVEAWLQYAADRLAFTRFYNDAFIVANCVAWPLAAPAMVGWIIGGAGFAQMFAARARAMMHNDRPLLGLILGALTASFAFFLPAIGWFVFLPLMSLMAMGPAC